jgi:hypothetical protein
MERFSYQRCKFRYASEDRMYYQLTPRTPPPP